MHIPNKPPRKPYFDLTYIGLCHTGIPFYLEVIPLK